MSNEIRSEVILISFNNFYYHVEMNHKIDTFNNNNINGIEEERGKKGMEMEMLIFCILNVIQILNALTSCNHHKLPQFTYIKVTTMHKQLPDFFRMAE